jgi:hypothetical protein
MKLLRLLCAVAAASITLQAVPTFAHGTKKDNDVSVYIHIDPNDRPVAGKTSTIYFFITDKDNKYTDANCNCRVKVEQNGKILYDKVVHEKEYLGDPTSIAVKYVFPRLGTYQVSIDGQPQKTGQFQSFNLEYPIKIATGTPVSSISTTQIGIGGGIIVIILATAIVMRPRKQRQKDVPTSTI